MDFSGFEAVDNSHPRKGGYTVKKEQSYENMKYRKAPKKVQGKDGAESIENEGRFYIANTKIKELGLDGPNGLRQFTNPTTGQTLFCVVVDKDASILKTKKSKNPDKVGKKAKNFKSDKLEAALEQAKMIDSSAVKVNQYLNLTQVAENVTVKDVACIKVFTISKGVAKVQVKEEQPAATLASSTGASAPKAAPVAAAKGEWD